LWKTEVKADFRSSRHQSTAGNSPAERHPPANGTSVRSGASGQTGESPLSLQRLNFKTRKKKRKKFAAKKIGVKSEDDDDFEDLGEEGSEVKSLAGRLLKRERRSLDSAGSSEHSSSEDGNRRKGEHRSQIEGLVSCVADPDPVGSVDYWLSWIRIRMLYTDPNPAALKLITI